MLPKELEQFGLIAAIEGLIQTSFSKTGVKVSFEHFGIKARFSYPIELSIFRILQELITNILKHANATEVKIELLKRKNSIMLIVEDNGKGFDPENIESKGIGIKNINSRIAYLNATKDIISNSKGTSYTIEIDITKLNDH